MAPPSGAAVIGEGVKYRTPCSRKVHPCACTLGADVAYAKPLRLHPNRSIRASLRATQTLRARRMLRLFLAITPPPERVLAMLDLLVGLDLPPYRATKRDQTHLTAMFIGERSELDLESILDAVKVACAGIGPFRLKPVLLTALPARGLKRTVVLECDRPAGLLELHDRLVRRFGREIRAAPREKFFPHITIARFAAAGERVTLKSPVSLHDFPVDGVRLISSVLKPEGAVHHEIALFAFSPS